VAGDPGYDLQSIELGTGIWDEEQILHVYNTAVPPLLGLTYAAEPAPEAAEPILYPAFPSSDQALFETALLQACDALDGVADGVIDNLPACQSRFDPATATYISGGTTYPLQCPGAKNATCLSPAQIQALISTHQGAMTTDGQPVFAPSGAVAEDHSDNQVFGYLYDGGWGTSSGLFNRDVGTAMGAPGNWGSGLLQFVYASISPADPTYNPMTFNFTTDQGLLTQSTPFSTTSTSLDISKFINYGHKIIFYHSAGDPGINALNTISYYNGMAQLFGGLEAAQNFSRLYLIPNMGHCSGGPATDQFDMLTPLVDWVENGTPPGPIPAKGVNFNAATYQVGIVTGAPSNAPTTRSRPLCPYPQEAHFIGSVTNGTYGGTSVVPVAANPMDLAVASNYICITPPPPYIGSTAP
jgi:feruloyl esterase